MSLSPVVALNRAIALAELHGPARRWPSSSNSTSTPYYLLHATRADLLERLGRLDEAVAAYDAALARTSNAAERRLLEARREASR